MTIVFSIVTVTPVIVNPAFVNVVAAPAKCTTPLIDAGVAAAPVLICVIVAPIVESVIVVSDMMDVSTRMVPLPRSS